MIALLKTHPFFSDKQIESCTLLEHQGYCNENYLVVVDGVKYIVRSLKQEDDQSKNKSLISKKLIYDLGIAAKPLVFDEKIGLMDYAISRGRT